jgi:hypothetical protein
MTLSYHPPRRGRNAHAHPAFSEIHAKPGAYHLGAAILVLDCEEAKPQSGRNGGAQAFPVCPHLWSAARAAVVVPSDN